MDGETANAKAARLEALWTTLDTKKTGELDLVGLKRGLKQMDHPLKNADALLKDVLKAVDSDGNGRISYNEFELFVTQAERQLYGLFRSIDLNDDGKLDKTEMRSAFLKAGLAVPDSKLDRFFDEVDTDRDGVISFDEWRDFLLFIPVTAPSLNAVLSYFSSTMRMNPEGDVQISDDIIDGLGIKQHFPKILDVLFGALIRIAHPPKYVEGSLSMPDVYSSVIAEGEISPQPAAPFLPPEVEPLIEIPLLDEDMDAEMTHGLISVLIPYLPIPGYFVAGGLSGIVSRTATAPLDRLKVYLIAQTDVAQDALSAAKSGNPIVAIRRGFQSLANATMELWRAGGMRSLYAGNGLNVIKVMPESAIKFGSYEGTKRIFASLEGIDDPRHIQAHSKFIAGGVAGMVSQFAVYPIDTLKFRMQCELVGGGLHGNRLIVATFKKMWQQGFTSFYRGLPMGLVGIFPYAAIDLGTFEYLKHALATKKAKKLGCHEEQAQPGALVTAAIGGFSGALGASVVYPLNLLRTRLQSQGTVLHPRTYTGIMDVTRQTIQGEGFRGLFKGLTPNLLKVVPAVSITYVVYENAKKALHLP